MAKRYYTVWSVEFENDSRAKVSLSRSRKVRDNDYDKSLENAGIANNGYITDFSDSYVNFVGKAVNQLKKYEIKERDRIYCDIDISNEPYVDKDGNKAYPKGYKHTVYEFELPGSSEDDTTPAQTPKNIDREPRVGADVPAPQSAPVTSTIDDAEDEDSLPF